MAYLRCVTHLDIQALRVGAEAYTPGICKNKDPYKTCLLVWANRTVSKLVGICSSRQHTQVNRIPSGCNDPSYKQYGPTSFIPVRDICKHKAHWIKFSGLLGKPTKRNLPTNDTAYGGTVNN